MNEIEVHYGVRVDCGCGAKISCRTRSVGKTKLCPLCRTAFIVPHPEPPPRGSLWIVQQRLSAEEYAAHAEALINYGVAISAIGRFPDLHWHITRTVEVISEIQSLCRFPTSIEAGPTPISPLARLAKGPSFAGCKTPHRRYT